VPGGLVWIAVEFLTHNREESVFVYPVVLLYQGVSFFTVSSLEAN